MRNLSRVIWSEGMYLGPHHFQAQSRYFEDSIQFATANLWFNPRGLLGLGLDEDALENGVAAVTHARGVFPDGLAFHMPEHDPVPPPFDIREAFPALDDRAVLRLTAPAIQPEGRNCVLEGEEPSTSARYLEASTLLPDENTGRDEKPIKLGRKNIRLALDPPAGDESGLVTLPIARVLRDGAGGFSYDPQFIPPLLRISGSRALMQRARALIEVIEDRCRTIARPKSPGRPGTSGFSAEGIANLWFLHCVNQGLAPLRHLALAKDPHPEELFLELSRLGGALCTFGIDSHPSGLPLYDHDNLTDCFAEIDAHIREHLELLAPSNCVEIPLRPRARYVHEGRVEDQRTLGRSRWIFGIRSSIGESELIQSTPRLVKICSKQFLPKLVSRALPGLELKHLSIPPAAISPKVEHQYFAIEKAGPCWEHLVKTKELGVYVPGELTEPEIELFVVLES